MGTPRRERSLDCAFEDDHGSEASEVVTRRNDSDRHVETCLDKLGAKHQPPPEAPPLMPPSVRERGSSSSSSSAMDRSESSAATSLTRRFSA